MTKIIKYKVTGKVQGVFFRKYTKLAADKYGVKGWVMNDPNNKKVVIGEAQGSEEALQKFTKYLYTGSPKAVVEEVKVAVANDKTTGTEYITFDVRK